MVRGPCPQVQKELAALSLQRSRMHVPQVLKELEYVAQVSPSLNAQVFKENAKDLLWQAQLAS